MPQLPLSGHVFSVGSCKFCCRLCWCYLWCHRCVWKNRNRLINSLQVKTFRALYDNPQWENSILVTPQRIFLHQEYSSTKNIPPPSQNDFLPRLVAKNLAEYVRKLTSSTLPQLTTTSLTTKETS